MAESAPPQDSSSASMPSATGPTTWLSMPSTAAEQVATSAEAEAASRSRSRHRQPERVADHTCNLRFRIEHAQVLLPSDFDRFTQLGVIASMQPSHLLTDMNWAAARLGPERAKYSYAWRSMLDHGVTLAFGTDYPVESINPSAACTRQSLARTRPARPPTSRRKKSPSLRPSMPTPRPPLSPSSAST